jgi:hypothetical protein
MTFSTPWKPHQQVDASKEIGGTAPRHGALSNVAADQRAAYIAEGSGVGDHGGGLPQGENGTLPALARQIYYQARPKIMEMTDDKELAYGYFSQTLLPDYIEQEGVAWNVVYDARGHLEEPHTNRRIGVGTIEIGNYLHAIKEPEIAPAEFSEANVEVIGPSGNLSGVLFCEKEGFNPLFKAANLANRHDLMIISTKGVSVTAARLLIDEICGGTNLPLFVLHDFDDAGFMIFGTLHRDTRRYQFSNLIEPINLGLRLEDIDGLEREPAAATKTNQANLREQLEANGATDAEIDILLDERVELNALTSDQLLEMIERKLQEHGLKKVIPDDDLLAKTYQAFHASQELRDVYEAAKGKFNATKIDIPGDLKEKVRSILVEHDDLRWDDAIQIILDESQLDCVRAKKRKSKKKSGDFTDTESEEDADDDDAGADI